MELQGFHFKYNSSHSSSGSGGAPVRHPAVHQLLCPLQQHRKHHRLYLGRANHTSALQRRLRAAASPGQPSSSDGLPANSPSTNSSSSNTATASPIAAQTSPQAEPTPSAAAAAAAADVSGASAGQSPAATNDAVSKARQELINSWQLLKDAAGTAFIPGYKQQAAAAAATAANRQRPRTYSALLQDLKAGSSQQQQQPQQQDIVSVPERLNRLLSGQFIKEREASSSRGRSQQQQQQEGNAQFAAVQFELLQRLQQQQLPTQPQQQQVAAAAAAGDATQATAAAATDAAVSLGVDGIIDVTPQTPTQPPTPPPAAAAAAGAASATEPAAGMFNTGTPPPAAAAAAGADASEGSDFYPATTQVLVICTWAVFLLQWSQALPDLWGVLTGGRLLDAAAALLLAFPDTPVTRSLCLDLTALQQGTGWLGLITSGLCNSGFVATWLCCAALANCGRFLEAGSGQLQLLTVFLTCTLAASAGHIFAGRCALGVTGPGAVLGVYTTWSVLATRYMRDAVSLRTIYTQGLMLLAVLIGLGFLQPAVSAASLVGGMLGGVLAVVIAGPCSEALRWCLALPAMAGLLVLKLGIDLLQVVWFAVVFVAAAGWQMVRDVVGTVRRL